MKKLIRLTESDLHRIVNRSVRKCINEIGDTPRGQYALGKLTSKYENQNADKSNSIFDYSDDAYNKSKYPNKKELSTAFDQGQEGFDFYPQEDEMRKSFDEANTDANNQKTFHKDVAAQLIADNADIIVNKEYDGTFDDFLDLCCISYALQKCKPNDDKGQSAFKRLIDRINLSPNEYDIVKRVNTRAFES